MNIIGEILTATNDTKVSCPERIDFTGIANETGKLNHKIRSLKMHRSSHMFCIENNNLLIFHVYEYKHRNDNFQGIFMFIFGGSVQLLSCLSEVEHLLASNAIKSSRVKQPIVGVGPIFLPMNFLRVAFYPTQGKGYSGWVIGYIETLRKWKFLNAT